MMAAQAQHSESHAEHKVRPYSVGFLACAIEHRPHCTPIAGLGGTGQGQIDQKGRVRSAGAQQNPEAKVEDKRQLHGRRIIQGALGRARRRRVGPWLVMKMPTQAVPAQTAGLGASKSPGQVSSGWHQAKQRPANREMAREGQCHREHRQTTGDCDGPLQFRQCNDVKPKGSC